MAPAIRLTSTVYGHFSSRMPHETTTFASLSSIEPLLSSFAPTRLNISDIHDWISSFALDPLSLPEIIAILIAVYLTAMIGVSFIGGLGPVSGDKVCLEDGKKPKSLVRNFGEMDVSYYLGMSASANV